MRNFNQGKAMRWGRRIVSTLITGGITFTVVAPASWLAGRLGWLEKMQMIPATATLSIVSLVIIGGLTLVFGRLYCSTVCPIGWVMDLVAKTPRATKKLLSRRPYRYSPAYNRIRLIAFLIIIGSGFLGTTVVIKIFSPYTAYTNMVEGITGRGAVVTALSTVIAWLTLVVVAIVSWRRGRALCNTVCPVGTLLGAISKRPLLHIDINTDLCTNCRNCVDRCKSHCINLEEHTVDMTRCVVCFDCLTDCEPGAIAYTTGRHTLKLPMMMPADPSLSACSGGTPHATITQQNKLQSSETISRPS